MKRNLFLLLILLLVLGQKNSYIITENKNADYCGESYVASKIGRYRNDKFVPVMVYQKTNFKGTANFVGMGSLFLLNNTVSIITSEHLFNKENRNSFFFCKNIFTGEIYDIKRVVSTGRKITKVPSDIILLEIGKAKKISHIFKEKIEVSSLINYDKPNNILVSLLTGEKVRITEEAIVYSNKYKIKYLVIDYVSEKGESGTGFVDNKNNIYVLKASIGENRKKSIVYGPLSF